MQGERILRAALYIARIRESSPNAHAYRIKAAQKLSEIIEAFVAEEVRRATSKNQSDPTHVSWAQVGSLMNISKSAAYSRYGGQKDDTRR